jgi:hypothetical protein
VDEKLDSVPRAKILTDSTTLIAALEAQRHPKPGFFRALFSNYGISGERRTFRIRRYKFCFVQ